MFTDAEVGMAIAHGRRVRSITRDAQSIIDGKNAAIDEAHSALEMAYAEIRKLQGQLVTETARRQAAEIQVDQLKALAMSLA